MLQNTITLSVDQANNGTPINEEYRRYTESTDKSVYIGAGTTSLKKNHLAFGRIAAKPSASSLGIEKRQLKITETETVDSRTVGESVLADAIGTVSFNFPVGMSSARRKAFRQRLIAALDDDSIMDNFCDLGEI